MNEVTPSQGTLDLFTNTLCYKKPEDHKFQFIEDPRESAFSHRKFLLMEKLMFIETLFFVCLSMLKTEIDMMENPQSTMFSSNLQVVISISNAFSSTFILMQ